MAIDGLQFRTSEVFTTVLKLFLYIVRYFCVNICFTCPHSGALFVFYFIPEGITHTVLWLPGQTMAL